MKTTVQGSYPLYPGVERRTFRPLSEEEPEDPFLGVIEECVRDQIDAGIDIVSDGQTRSDMLRIFTRKIPFIKDLDNVLLVSDKIERTIPLILDDLKFVVGILPRQTQTKGILTGPYTLASSCEFNSDAYKDKGELAFDFAEMVFYKISRRDAISCVFNILCLQYLASLIACITIPKDVISPNR